MNSHYRLTEAQFLRQVLALAKLHGWRRAHFRPARTATGWTTAVQGDGKGFPDLLLLRGTSMLVAELKIPPNEPTTEQLAWLENFRAAGIPGYIWTPADWPAIEHVLRR
jgi:hypothetical protein